MPRRREIPERVTTPDSKYNSLLVAKFVNCIMRDGKKSVAESTLYDALDVIGEKTNEPPLKMFEQAVDNVRPLIEVKSRRVGGSTYQVPTEIRPSRRTALGIRWIITYARQRPEKGMAKKLAAGATHLLVDIPTGPSAKVRNQRDALRLRKLFEFVGDRVGLHLEVLITDGHQPIGRGIGPVLEARDVMQVLENDPQQPRDLREKALQLASRILEFDPDVRGGQGYTLARDILESGRALEKMQAIIAAQGASAVTREVGHLCHTISAEHDGSVAAIDNQQMARIARLAGAPMDQGAGVDLYRKVGDKVKRGDALYAIHAEFDADFAFAREAAGQSSGFRLAR